MGDFLRFQAIINKLWSELINTDYCGKGRPIILRKDLGSSRRGSRVGLFSGFRVGFLQVPVFLSTGWLFFWAFSSHCMRISTMRCLVWI